MDIARHVDEIRAEFPVLAYLRYMNSAAHRLALGRVKQGAIEWWDFYTYENNIVKAPDAKGEIAKALSVEKDDITWVNRVSQAMNTISSMLSLKRGGEHRHH